MTVVVADKLNITYIKATDEHIKQRIFELMHVEYNLLPKPLTRTKMAHLSLSSEVHRNTIDVVITKAQLEFSCNTQNMIFLCMLM